MKPSEGSAGAGPRLSLPSGAELRGVLRGLLRHRSVLFLAAGCLALGLGTCASMLGLLDVLLFRPPAHVKEAASVRRVYVTDTRAGFGEYTTNVLSYPTFQDLLATRSFAAAGAWFRTTVSLGQGATAEKASALLVTPGFLTLLGVAPARGRLFERTEGRPGPPDFVALVSTELARRAFGGIEGALGKRIPLGRDVYTIVGVLPPRFTGVDLARVDVWLPMNAASKLFIPDWAESRGSSFVQVAVRLRPGVPEPGAQAEATSALRAGAAAAERPKPRARVTLSAIQAARGPNPPAAARVTAWLAGLSWIVLLISCANASGLLLTRTLERRAELGVRRALGARSGRLVGLAVLEGLAIGALGGLGGAVVTPLLGSLVQRIVLPEAGAPFDGLSPRTLGLLAALALLVGLLAALAPALWLTRHDPSAGLHGGRTEPGQSRLQAGLAMAQIAFTFVLLVSAGAFGWSLFKVLHLDLGLDADQVLVAKADLEAAGYPPTRIDETWQRAEERARLLPGVSDTARAATIPFATSTSLGVEVPGIETQPELSTGSPYVNAVSEGFFRTTGTRVLKGRPFSAEDTAGSAPVAIVNATMERLFWPAQGALDSCVRISGPAGSPCFAIVGVVEDARRSRLQEEPTMQWYVPLSQAPKDLGGSRALLLRGRGDLGRLAGSVRREVQALDSGLPFIEVRTLADLLEPQRQPWRMGVSVLALLSLLALALAVAGLYGVMVAAMARRRFEMGVRSALGAEWRHILGQALRKGLGIALGGIAAGLLLAYAAALRLNPLLFEVSAFHPLLLLGAALVLLATALLASFFPARRIWRSDLFSVLREE